MIKNRINRNIVFLGLVSFLNDLSSEMIMPILPMFITALGGTETIVGLVGGVRDSLSSILKLVFGWLSDRTGKRKIFVISGYVTSAVFKFFLGLSKLWIHIAVFAGLERVGKGLRTAPRDALISTWADRKLGKGFGFHRAMDTSGAVLGSLLAFLLFWFLGLDFRTIILIAAVLAFASLIPLKFVKEKRQDNIKPASFRVSMKWLSGSLRFFIAVSGVFALANFSYMFFLLRARDALEGRLGVGIPILLYALFNIFYASFSVPFGNLSDRIGRKKVIIMGYLLFSLTCIGFSLFKSIAAYIILFALYGVVHAIVDGNQRAFVSDISAGELRATALGTFHAVTGLAALPASLTAGFLWKITPAVTFIYGSAVSMAAVILFLFFPVPAQENKI